MYVKKLALLAANPKLIGKLVESLGDMPNIESPTLGGHFFWVTLAEVDGWKLQRNKLTKHCRILDPDDIRKAWGSENAMAKALQRLEAAPQSLVHEFNQVDYGDVIGVNRGLYEHYGVYLSHDRVIHYASANGDFFGGQIRIHETTLSHFVKPSEPFFVCKFPEEYGEPSKISLSASPLSSAFFSQWTSMLNFMKRNHYRLYSPEETVQRALSRLGETNYNLASNNCEHFAIWCKTGISESHQVNQLIGEIPIVKNIFTS